MKFDTYCVPYLNQREDGDPSSSSHSQNSMIVDAPSGLHTLADADRNFLPCLVKVSVKSFSYFKLILFH